MLAMTAHRQSDKGAKRSLRGTWEAPAATVLSIRHTANLTGLLYDYHSPGSMIRTSVQVAPTIDGAPPSGIRAFVAAGSNHPAWEAPAATTVSIRATAGKPPA
jgi:hypothetical protein